MWAVGVDDDNSADLAYFSTEEKGGNTEFGDLGEAGGEDYYSQDEGYSKDGDYDYPQDGDYSEDEDYGG